MSLEMETKNKNQREITAKEINFFFYFMLLAKVMKIIKKQLLGLKRKIFAQNLLVLFKIDQMQTRRSTFHSLLKLLTKIRLFELKKKKILSKESFLSPIIRISA